MRLAGNIQRRLCRPGFSRCFASVAGDYSQIPQTIIEKVVQRYTVGLPAGKVVKSGDYVMIQPEHVMTHDNTGPVISKWAFPSFTGAFLTTYLGSTPLVQAEYRILDSWSLR